MIKTIKFYWTDKKIVLESSLFPLKSCIYLGFSVLSATCINYSVSPGTYA